MSAHFSAASAALTSDSSALASGPHGSVNRTSSVSESLPNTGPASRATATSELSQLNLFDQSTCSVVAFPVRTSASPVKAPGWTEPARVFGPNMRGSLASFDPDTSSWKTSPDSVREGLAASSGKWPRSGMTRNGTAYLLQPLARPTGVIGSGSWPTPRAQEGGPDYAKLERGKKPGHSTSPSLATAVALSEQGLWPTPTASDARKGYSSPPGPSNDRGRETLSGQVHARGQVRGQLNPQFVEWLMGFPIDWTAVTPSETHSSPKSQSGSGDE